MRLPIARTIAVPGGVRGDGQRQGTCHEQHREDAAVCLCRASENVHREAPMASSSTLLGKFGLRLEELGATPNELLEEAGNGFDRLLQLGCAGEEASHFGDA